MRAQLLKSCLVLMLAVASACGGLPEETAPEPVGDSAQAVLYPPPTPSSGNILDSTAYMGAVSFPGSVQTQFTTSPQYFSFTFQAPAGTGAKLEVTHLGSSMYLDTGLFVYGPKQANGSYGTAVLAQDDDAGYGQLSKIAGVSLAAGGEYLVVVSSGSGAGKRFRLQLDCISGACPPAQAPSGYSLQLTEEALTPQLQEIQDEDIYWGCEGACNGYLRTYHFPWTYAGEPTLDMATRALDGMGVFYDKAYYPTGTYPYVDLEPQLLPIFSTFDVPQVLLSTYWNGMEDVRFAAYASPVQGSDWNIFVILFPQSRKVVTVEQEHYW
jgi:hypothetical protein